MDLKVGDIGSKWNTILSKSATFAKEGLDFVNKQITDIKTTINQNGNSRHDTPLNLDNYSSSTRDPRDDPISSALYNNQIPIFFYYSATICPTQCSTCHPYSILIDSTIKQSSLTHFPKSSHPSCSDQEAHLFFLPPNIQSNNNLTVQQLKHFLPLSLIPTSNESIHLRFKSLPPIEDQDIFEDFVWVDVDDNSLPPTFHGSIHMQILHAPISVPSTSSHSTHHQIHNLPHRHRSSVPQTSYHHNQPSSSNQYLPKSDIRIDLLCDGNSHNTPDMVHHNAYDSHLSHTGKSVPLSSTQNEFDRVALMSQREAKKEARIQEVMNEHSGSLSDVLNAQPVISHLLNSSSQT